MLTVLGGLADFERSLIIARASEGRARAKARGAKFSPPKKLSVFQQAQARKRLETCEAPSLIAQSCTVSSKTSFALQTGAAHDPSMAQSGHRVRADHCSMLNMEDVAERHAVEEPVARAAVAVQ
jgi:hypothetical protein